MPKRLRLELVGQKFGRLLVESFVDVKHGSRWNCVCDCGSLKVVASSSLVRGMTKSCGCLYKDRTLWGKRKPQDISGRRFGRLIVIKFAGYKETPNSGRQALWECQCDCGKITHVQGGKLRANRTKSCGCYRIDCAKARTGAKNPRWKGGKSKRSGGYVWLRDVKHPHAHNGYVAQHRLIMEKHIGRYLYQEETVHHKNGIRDDNRIENLELWCSSHPRGQRVEDLLIWALSLLDRYGNTAGKLETAAYTEEGNTVKLTH